MKKHFPLALVFALASSLVGVGQQPSPQPPQPLASQPPCDIKPMPAKSAGGIHVHLPKKLQQQIENKTGFSVPDLSQGAEQAPAIAASPCPAKTIAAAVPPPPPIVRLPPDTFATFHCNPMTPAAKDGAAHPTTLTLPDPHDYATPRPNTFEADNVVPDLAAKLPCYDVKVDPKTNKVFVAQ